MPLRKTTAVDAALLVAGLSSWTSPILEVDNLRHKGGHGTRGSSLHHWHASGHSTRLTSRAASSRVPGCIFRAVGRAAGCKSVSRSRMRIPTSRFQGSTGPVTSTHISRACCDRPNDTDTLIRYIATFALRNVSLPSDIYLDVM
ncbi:hypothetical protein KC359_g177 [Hortaea werneckii]|nr:hypothetical protein KC359_g177 [Hortaea werneckii]